MKRYLPVIALLLAVAAQFGLMAVAQQSDVGEVHFVNSGSAAAQAAFLRGLALLHDFEYERAARDFREAEKMDPGFAMAYWGEAMTFNHPVWMEQDLASARTALRKLGATPEERLAKAPTEREKDYLRAVETLYGEGPKEERDFRYADAMAALHARYPDDVDAAAFYALSLLGAAHHGRDFATYMRAAAVLEPLFYSHPHHPGLAHYLIHSFDDPIHAPLGLDAARAYSKIAPGAAHAQHMTSHIFVALGMWDDVVRANENAMAVVDRERKAAGRGPSACGHYNFWLEYGYLQQGRKTDAFRLLDQCRQAAERAPVVQGKAADRRDPDASLAGSYAVMRTRYLLDSKDWNGAAAHWTVPAAAAPAARLSFAFGTAFAALQRNDSQAAQDAKQRLEAAASELGRIPAQNEGSNYSARGEILQQQLQAIMLLQAGKRDEGVGLLRKAASAEASLPFEFGPPFIDKPGYELLGEVLLQLNRSKEAAEAFKTALARAPGRAESLAGLAAAKKADP